MASFSDHISNIHFILAFVASLYFSISFLVFNKVFETSYCVIDELFHIPQGMQYCNNNFTYWEPKITTLPGLYLASKLLSILFLECSIYVLRFTNLLAAFINFYLIVLIIEKQNNLSNLDLKCIFQAVNLAILPPLYFFSHVYYTDTLSLTFILLYINYTLSKKYGIAMIAAVVSILMRQTNVVWIGFFLARKMLDCLYRSYIKSIKGKDLYKKTKNTHIKEVSIRIYTTVDVIHTMIFHFKTFFMSFFKLTTFNDLYAMFCNATVINAFFVFVFLNGSIVVGDKSAHSPTIHLPQLFYFTVFYAVFSAPLLLSTLRRDLKRFVKSQRTTLFLVMLCMTVACFNTLVHPYLLADNRHYTFYVWNRFYGRYWFAKYLIIPLYIYVFYSILNNVRSLGAGFILPYIFCLFVSLCLQRMLEIRYFLIPYIILRVSYEIPSWKVIICEFIFYIVINMAAFHIFFTKEIHWATFKDTQRLIW